MEDNLVSDKVKSVAIQTAVKNMWKKGWFNVCTFKKICEVAGIRPDSEVTGVLELYHCVNWGEMSKEEENRIAEMIFHTFSKDAFPIQIFDNLKVGEPMKYEEQFDVKQTLGFSRRENSFLNSLGVKLSFILLIICS